MAASLILYLVLRNLTVFQPSVLPFYYLITTTAIELPEKALRIEASSELDSIERNRNAVWLEHRWLQDGISDAELNDLCRTLKTNGVMYVFPHLSPAGADGHLPVFSKDAAKRFRQILKQNCPEIKILPWVGGVKVGFHQMQAGTVQLDSDSYLQTFASECARLMHDFDFDGVHLNIEPLDSGNQRLPEWLEYLRSRIDGKILSIAASKPSFLEGLNFSPERSWDVNYFARVGKECDQMVIMNYDTGLWNSFLYSLFVREKISAILRRFAQERLPCKVLLGVPTYDAAPRHNVETENVAAALKGLIAALSLQDVPKDNFEGVALYAYWTTDEKEWRDFTDMWLDVKQR